MSIMEEVDTSVDDLSDYGYVPVYLGTVKDASTCRTELVRVFGTLEDAKEYYKGLEYQGRLRIWRIDAIAPLAYFNQKFVDLDGMVPKEGREIDRETYDLLAEERCLVNISTPVYEAFRGGKWAENLRRVNEFYDSTFTFIIKKIDIESLDMSHLVGRLERILRRIVLKDLSTLKPFKVIVDSKWIWASPVQRATEAELASLAAKEKFESKETKDGMVSVSAKLYFYAAYRPSLFAPDINFIDLFSLAEYLKEKYGPKQK